MIQFFLKTKKLILFSDSEAESSERNSVNSEELPGNIGTINWIYFKMASDSTTYQPTEPTNTPNNLPANRQLTSIHSN